MASNLVVSRRGIRLVLLAASVLTLPSLCHATNNCPWLNEATASGFIGGDATGTFTEPSPGQPAVCSFVQTTPGFVRTLRITVEVTPDFQSHLGMEAKACSAAGAPMKAIGNEAILCSADSSKKLFAERVVGRVRDQVFTITLSTSAKDDFVLTADERKKRVAAAAEQVAGNLF